MADSIKKDSTRIALVDPGYYWRPIGSCPAGLKVQLLSRSGIASIGKFVSNRDGWWIGWAPLPKIPPGMKELIK